VALAVAVAGSHIQLAGRERQIQGLSERLLCLTGSLTSNVAAANFILQILHDDPSGKYDNVSTSYRGYVQPSQQRSCGPLLNVSQRSRAEQLLARPSSCWRGRV